MFTTLLMAGVLACTYGYQNGYGSNDHVRIQRIADNAGLVARDGKKIRIHRKSKRAGYMEYAYQLPDGLSSQMFRDKLDRFQDGLNVKRSVLDVSLSDLKAIDWGGDIIAEIKALIARKRKQRKEVEMDFDGMLIFRVYEEGLPEYYEFTEADLNRVKGWQVPVGVSRLKYLTHDFDKIPHLIVAGTTDFGKSNWLKSTITTLIHRKPDHATFTLIDLKGGLSFNRYRDVKQVGPIAKSPQEALEALQTVQERMNGTMDYLIAHNYEDVKEAGLHDRHFIVIDEAADIADHKGCVEIIKDIARRGRAAGYRLIYSTQYPTAQTVDSQVKRNCLARLCFVLDTAIASTVVLDQAGAESLPLIKGRAIYKTVKCTEVQTPYIANEFISTKIYPHINIRPRKEPTHAKTNRPPATGGTNTLVIEEV